MNENKINMVCVVSVHVLCNDDYVLKMYVVVVLYSRDHEGLSLTSTLFLHDYIGLAKFNLVSTYI